MEGDERGRQPSFKVQDRRRFSASGETREDTAEERADAPPSPDPAPPVDIGAAPDAAAGGELTFATFVFSLSTQALVHLGEIADPVDGATRVHLDGARQIIDILAILADKTRGNLDEAEKSLLESALYDLRMRYVERARPR
jgi:Domain of unknown function (DUF1844)